MNPSYTYTMNDNKVECPYCGHSYQPESEDFSENEREDECSDCGKKYHLSQSFTVTHQARPDCELNGGKHDYQEVSLRGDKTHPFCMVCDKCQPHSELEKQSN